MPAGLASLVLQAQAFFTIILGAFAFGERLQGKQLVGIALAVFGVLVLIEASLNGQHVGMLGFMLTLAAALSWACGNIFNKKIMQHTSRPAVMSLVVWSALIPIVPFSGLITSRWPNANSPKSGGDRYDNHSVTGVSGVRGDHCGLWHLGDVTRTL